jgi:Flp pilus assembly protein TadB
MNLVYRLVPLLQAALGLLFALLLMLQWFSFPGQFAYMAREQPEDADLRWPLTVYVGVLILCVQVVVVCTWRLLSMVRQDAIFSVGALRWVDVIIASLATGWTLAAAGSLWAVWGADDPGGPLLLFVVLLVAAAFGLVVVVMRELLRQATTLRSELAEVI